MTQFSTLKRTLDPSPTAGTSTYSAPYRISETGLFCAARRQIDFEIASFHTPGHKGRALSAGFTTLQDRLLRSDLTELPGLDDLSNPSGAICEIEARAAQLWRARQSLISVGGASAGLIAALCAAAQERAARKIALPRNAHRSAVQGLILSGLEPVWYEPIWESRWGVWGAVTPHSIEQLLNETADCDAVLVVSPTYPGAVSDIRSIASVCRQREVLLIVDEAHGAHMLPGLQPALSAVPWADITVHSLHKTLPALTQTGLIHVGSRSALSADALRAALNLVHSSSPSYPLLLSIECTLDLLESSGVSLLEKTYALAASVQEKIGAETQSVIYSSGFATDPLHIFIASCCDQPSEINGYLQSQRIFSEAELGKGLLFLLGIGSRQADTDVLIAALSALHSRKEHGAACDNAGYIARVPHGAQVMKPREAFFMPSEVVPIHEAVGRIAHQCVAPCPPGIPLCIPGQRVQPEVMNIESLRSLRVVKEN